MKDESNSTNEHYPAGNTFRHSHHIIKSLKATQDARRSPVEKFADVLTSSFGSIYFLVANIIWFVLWIVWNAGLIPGLTPFDPYPFGLLTTTVSLEAIMLAIIVLISQNREAKMADLREEIDLQVDIVTEQEITKVMELMTHLLRKEGIDVAHDKVLHDMLRYLDMNKIEQKLEREIEVNTK